MWTPFNFFVGSWEGTGTGQPGASQVERTYQFVLNGKFLHVKNKSTYERGDHAAELRSRSAAQIRPEAIDAKAACQAVAG